MFISRVILVSAKVSCKPPSRYLYIAQLCFCCRFPASKVNERTNEREALSTGATAGRDDCVRS